MTVYELYPRFAELFDGLKVAHGTGRGQWIKRPLRSEDWVKHLQGEGPGIGVAPLREDNTVAFAAIDLDEPDFEAAAEMQRYLPGEGWVECSRSGNAHVWVFFRDPCPAWVAMGVLKETTLAVLPKSSVEVFPKNHDFARVRLGNYINLPYHGDSRQVRWDPTDPDSAFSLKDFIERAEASRNDPVDWEMRAKMMQIVPPSERTQSAEFGTQQHIHICADHIMSGDAGPITEGHRNAVFFMLAKCVTNVQDYDHDEALDILRSVNADLCSPPEDDYELRRILTNVEQGRYTSTGCDDPLVQPFAHPDCPIANPRS